MMPSKGTTRRRFFELLVGVAVVHVVAIAVYYGLDISHSAARTQRIFAWIWMGVTVAVVLVGQQRLKRSRRRGSSAGPTP